MKKILSMLLCSVLILILAGCTSLSSNNTSSAEYEEYEVIEYENIQSAENEEAPQKESTATSKKTIINKVIKDGSSVSREPYAMGDDERLETIGGKSYMLKFKEEKIFAEAEDDSDTVYADVYVCEADDTEVWYDSDTDTMLRYYSGKYKDTDVAREINDSEKITEKKAYSIAKEFIKSYVDLSEYSLTPIQYSDYSEEFTVRYRVYIAGYKTERTVSVDLAKNGEITSFYNYPYDAFKGIEVASVNEDAIVERLKEEMLARYEHMIESCKITEKRLAVYDGEAVLVLSVSMVEVPGISLHQRNFGHTIYYPINLKDYSKIEGTITESWSCA